ncbi:flagellar protein FliT [Bacillus salacetis]|uniref:Flagellar protein FliT n=1 Tax=Bacillus salacetis TaxID=2315464 RepID=A0A3A1R755_9BACI|nr:flagellar protein FliT [Bacillus salacetis]RIW39051.1 flagellar protein FliT [Bacillus salacetis]
MSRVQECYDLTEKLVTMLKNPYEKSRDEVIAEIEGLLEERQETMKQMKAPYSEEEKELGRQIVVWNTEIEKGMTNLRNDIKRTINSVSKKKTTARKYSNPYASLQHDGMFYDKKK